ncbi:hypothetical protein K7432_008226 [Basidiobolus ranarum]
MGAFFLNDGVFIVISEIVFSICNDHGLHLHPFGLAIITSANIGSVAIIVGCPLNMIIYETTQKFSFFKYIIIMSLPAIVGVSLNTLCLCWFYNNRMEIDVPHSCSSVDYHTAIAEYERISQGIEPEIQQKELLISVIQTKVYGATKSDCLLSYDSLEYQHGNEYFETMEESNSDPIPIYCSNFSTSPESISPTQLLPDTPPTTPQIIMNNARPTMFVWPPPPASSKVSIASEEDGSSQVSSKTLQLPTPASANEPPPVPKLLIPARPFDGLTAFYGTITPSSSIHSSRSPRSPRSYGRVRVTLYEKAWREISGFWGSHFNGVVVTIFLVAMYFAMLLGLNPVWACCTTAALLALFNNTTLSMLLSHVNWTFLCYLCGIFVLTRGLLATPVLKDIWELIGPWLSIGTRNIHLTAWIFCLVIMIPNTIIGPFPTLLLVLPFLQDIEDPVMSLQLTLVLLWCAVLCSNLTPYSSIASRIVTDVFRQYYIDKTLDPRNGVTEIERSKRWFGRLQVWMRYTSWSTFMITMMGVPLILYNVDSPGS